MGQLRFVVPHRDRILPGAVEQAYLTGMEAVPFQSSNFWEGDQIVIARDVRESGSFNILWPVPERGPLLLSTASLMERPRPYLLPVELARGQLHRLRNQHAMWQSMGLAIPPPCDAMLRTVHTQLAQAATQQSNPAAASAQAEEAIVTALAAGDALAAAYVTQVLKLRHEQVPQLGTLLGGALPSLAFSEQGTRLFTSAFNAAMLPLSWRTIEPVEGEFDWSTPDRQFQWLKGKSLKVCAGPLVRLETSSLPDWLYLWEDDFEAIQSAIQQFITAVVTRYRGQVQVWHCAAGLNLPTGLSLSEEQKLRLSVLAIDAVRRTDPRTPVIVSFDQPWGEYLQQEEMDLPPYHFADALVRADLGLSGVGLEMNVGYMPGGTLPRDILELSRLIDRWSTLGVPLLAFVTAPSSSAPCPMALLKTRIVNDAMTPALEVEQMRPWIEMLVAKQSVHAVFWSQLADAEPHRWPHGGLLDAQGGMKPILTALAELRQRDLL